MGSRRKRDDVVTTGSISSCGNCRFFQSRVGAGGMGFCRAQPPVPLFLGVGKDAAGNTAPLVDTFWPQLPDTQWCGHWEHDATKLNLSSIDVSKLSEIEGSA